MKAFIVLLCVGVALSGPVSGKTDSKTYIPKIFRWVIAFILIIIFGPLHFRAVKECHVSKILNFYTSLNQNLHIHFCPASLVYQNVQIFHVFWRFLLNFPLNWDFNFTVRHFILKKTHVTSAWNLLSVCTFSSYTSSIRNWHKYY